MGCGASSLKGEKMADLSSEPVRRINTNFSAVDYSQEPQARRMTEYAPDEAPRRKSKASRASADAGLPATTGTTSDDTQLKPYQTIGDDRWNEDQPQEDYPHEKTHLVSHNRLTEQPRDIDPTSSAAKDEFATDNDPANEDAHDSTHRDDGSHKDRKQSWFGKKYAEYADKKSGRNAHYTDEELKTYTGRDRAELMQWAEQTPGVGANQPSGRLAMGRTSGLGAEGLSIAPVAV